MLSVFLRFFMIKPCRVGEGSPIILNNFNICVNSSFNNATSSFMTLQQQSLSGTRDAEAGNSKQPHLGELISDIQQLCYPGDGAAWLPLTPQALATHVPLVVNLLSPPWSRSYQRAQFTLILMQHTFQQLKYIFKRNF